MKSLINTILLLLLSFAPLFASAQNDLVNKSQLAAKFYRAGEYSKASVLYKELMDESSSTYYSDMYLDCLIKNKEYKTAEKEIKRRLRKNEHNSYLYVEWASMLKQQELQQQAEAKLNEALSSVSPNKNGYISLANTLISKREFNYAEKLFEQAKKKLPNESFTYEIGRLYYQQHNYRLMFITFLDLLASDENAQGQVQSTVGSALRQDTDNHMSKEFESILLGRMQQNPDILAYNRLLTWLYLRLEKFDKALAQQIALDKRIGGESREIMTLAKLATNKSHYNTAIDAYSYIQEKGNTDKLYKEALSGRIVAMFHSYYSAPEASNEQQLISESELVLDSIGFTEQSLPIVQNLAELFASNVNAPEKAIALLDSASQSRNLSSKSRNLLKLQLADSYAYTGDQWQAIIIYAQVEEANKSNSIGDEAKLRRAMLSYYMEELDWAKAQLDILKASTSKLIANDAMRLSFFLHENMSIDSLHTAAKMYARADWKKFSNKPKQAIAILDSLTQEHPLDILMDDILFLKAQLLEDINDNEGAKNTYLELLDKYPYSLVADEGTICLGRLYELKDNNKEKAQEYYLKILTNHPNSIYASEARIRYRTLRGDKVQYEEELVPVITANDIINSNTEPKSNKRRNKKTSRKKKK